MPGRAPPPLPPFPAGPPRSGASLGTGWEPASQLCARPAPPAQGEGDAFLRPGGYLPWAPSRTLHSGRSVLWVALPFSGPVPCLERAQPWAGGRGPASGLQLAASPSPVTRASPPCLRHTKGESSVLRGLARVGGVAQKGRGLGGALQPFGAAHLGSAAQALRARPWGPPRGSPPSDCVPFELQEPCLCVITMAARSPARFRATLRVHV